jgi:hypothetical protein
MDTEISYVCMVAKNLLNKFNISIRKTDSLKHIQNDKLHPDYKLRVRPTVTSVCSDSPTRKFGTLPSSDPINNFDYVVISVQLSFTYFLFFRQCYLIRIVVPYICPFKT